MMSRLSPSSSCRSRLALMASSSPLLSRFLVADRMNCHGCGIASKWFSSTSSINCSNDGKQLPSHKFLGLGGHKAHRIPFSEYCQVVQTALEQGIPVLESTSVANYSFSSTTTDENGGDALLAKALHRALEKSSHDLSSKPIIITLRLGYRTVMINKNLDSTTTGGSGSQDEEAKTPSFLLWPGDVMLEEYPVGMNDQQQQQDSTPTMVQRVLHNLSPDYLQHTLLTSPLFHLAQEFPNITLIPMIHNPEARQQQTTANDALQNNLTAMLTNAFVALEQTSRQHPNHILGFGVVSHGLTLPSSHPMNLDWKTVLLPAARDAAIEAAAGVRIDEKTDDRSNLSVIQLAANVLEPGGLMVAKAIREHCQSLDFSMRRPLQIWAMRPLTSYPDASSSNDSVMHPRKLVDVPLPTTSVTDTLSPIQAILHEPSSAATSTTMALSNEAISSSNIQMTHAMSSTSPPLIYQQALANAMAHFDATDILEKKQNGDDLTTAERETWDGCKLLQSMLHDLDSLLTSTIQLDSLQVQRKSQLKCFTSWEEYQDYLYQQVIPVLHDTFEEYDDESGTVLQEFFAAYGVAMRHALCHQTRNIILKQMADGEGAVKLEQSMPMQEFALRILLQSDSVSAIIVGFSHPKHVVKNLQTLSLWEDEQKTP